MFIVMKPIRIFSCHIIPMLAILLLAACGLIAMTEIDYSLSPLTWQTMPLPLLK